MRTSEVLNKAADLIEERGWGQGADTWNDWGAGLCLEGAIGAALGLVVNMAGPNSIWPQELDKCPAAQAVRAHIQWPEDRWLYRWNDADERTEAEVVEVLRAAADIEQAKEQQDAPQAVSA